MRYILIDLSSDNYLQQPNLFGGYEGEHNETILQVKLPKRMIDIECSGYRFDFQTSEDNKIFSPLIPVSELNNDVLSFHLTQQLTIAGKLLFNVVAILSDENTVSLISKTNTVTLRIEDAVDGNMQLIDPNGYKDELQKMVDERIMEINPAKVDQTYTPDSENAQSGKAVAEAVATEEKRADNTFANALKGTKSDTAMLLDDISPVTHNMDVKVRGKNLLSAMSLFPTITNNAVPIHFKAGQKYTISFTTTYTAWRLMFLGTDKNGTPFDNSSTDANKYISEMYTGTTGRLQHASNRSGNTFTFTCNEDCIITAIVFWNVSNETNKTYSDFQLELGSTATAYTPYVSDLTAVKVKRCGKNLFDTIGAVKFNGGSSFSVTNNTITVGQNSISNYSSANVLIPQSLIGKTVTISAKSNTSGANVAGLRIQWVSDSSGAVGDMILGVPDSAGNIVVTGTVPTQPDETHNNLCLMIYSNTTGTLEKGTTYTATYSDIQIELGSTVTDYEPYKECVEYTPTSDGTVEGVTSLYPNTTLTTDTAGVLINCEYNRDINKAFAALEAAIVTNS